MAELAGQSLPVPARLNLALLSIATAASAALLYFASHVDSALAFAACALAFSFTGNTLFSLLHEAVHGLFSPNHRTNEWAGRLAAAWFPTGLAVQRAFHLTHHRNNRSRLEQFDVLHDGDVKWLKYAQWYAILTGLYWLIAVLGVLIYMLVPRALQARLLRADDSKIAEQTSSVAYLAVLDDLDPLRARLEILLSLAFQVTLYWALDLSVAGWLACYCAFALSWSSLQYTDHAFSPLNASDGAWNLRVGPIGRVFFLNYHSHLAHHRNVRAPWIHLNNLIVAGEPRPHFFRVWLESWRGPRRMEDFPDLATPAPRFLALPRGVDAWFATGLAVAFLFLFSFFFGGANAVSGLIPWRFEVTLPFEALIPFVPETVFAYLALNPMLALAPFVLRRWQELLPLFAALVFATLVGAAFFVAFPVHTTFPERHVEGALGAVFAIADTLNLDRNFFPSLHVAFAIIAALAYAPKLAFPGRMVLFAVTAAITVSTVLIHEHQVLDVIGGIALALLARRIAGGWANRVDVQAALDIDLICAQNFAIFGRRHVRYWLIALGLLWDSLPRWRATRVLRTGFCFLQVVDDLLDGDRRSAREPLDIVNELVAAIQSGQYADDELMRLAKAFAIDMRAVGGEGAIDEALMLIDVMKRDHGRAAEKAILSRQELNDQNRATFSLSIALMLRARRSTLTAEDVPELIDALGWCSTMRDLREDLSKGLVNIPCEVLNAARAEGVSSIDHDSLVATQAVRTWVLQERVRADALLETAGRRLEQFANRPGAFALRIFVRSIRGFSRKRLPRLFPFLEPTASG